MLGRIAEKQPSENTDADDNGSSSQDPADESADDRAANVLVGLRGFKPDVAGNSGREFERLGSGVLELAADTSGIINVKLTGLDIGITANHACKIERAHAAGKVPSDRAGDFGAAGKGEEITADLAADAEPLLDGRESGVEREVERTSCTGQEGIVPDQTGNFDAGARNAQIVQHCPRDNDAVTTPPRGRLR